MGQDWVPAAVTNHAPAGVVLVVLNGDVEGNPTPDDFRTIGPGESSDSVFRSVDAFGAYRAGKPVDVLYEGVASPWWRVSDGTRCVVTERGNGLVLVVTEWLPHMPPPRPSTAAFWGFSGEEAAGIG